MTKYKQCNTEYKMQALKLAHEIGGQRAAEELVWRYFLSCWNNRRFVLSTADFLPW